jgi:hypothetical protein
MRYPRVYYKTGFVNRQVNSAKGFIRSVEFLERPLDQASQITALAADFSPIQAKIPLATASFVSGRAADLITAGRVTANLAEQVQEMTGADTVTQFDVEKLHPDPTTYYIKHGKGHGVRYTPVDKSLLHGQIINRGDRPVIYT